jgi:hypothetical protein
MAQKLVITCTDTRPGSVEFVTSRGSPVVTSMSGDVGSDYLSLIEPVG